MGKKKEEVIGENQCFDKRFISLITKPEYNFIIPHQKITRYEKP